jgi:hypothetical protein
VLTATWALYTGAKHALKLLLADGSSWILHSSSERDVTSWYQSLKEAIDEAQASMISKHQARATRYLILLIAPPLRTRW